MKKLRAYFWKSDKDADYGLAVVAENSEKAKRLGYSHWASDCGVEPETWIEQRIKWIKEANVDGLKQECIIQGTEGIKRNMYAFIEDESCEKCINISTLYLHKGKALCNNCIEGE